jgi:hypothetical protein
VCMPSGEVASTRAAQALVLHACLLVSAKCMQAYVVVLWLACSLLPAVLLL